MSEQDKRIVCPNGHSESFEVLGHFAYATYPEINATTYKCLTCNKRFDVEKKATVKPNIIDYTKP